MTSQHFLYNIQVMPEDIDELGHVNNVVYVRWVQEVAAAHWQSVAPKALHEKFSWVVLRHEVDYKFPAFKDDIITGETWVGEHHGARFDRFVKLTNVRDGRIVAQAKTTWCMLDAKTMKPHRITPEVLDLL